MAGNLLMNALGSRFLVDERNTILEIANFDTQLFFGREPILGKTVAESVGVLRQDEAGVIIDGIQKAIRGKRNSCFEYLSTHAKGEIYVSAWAEYRPDGLVCLYLTDLTCNRSKGHQSIDSSFWCEALFESLPIGVEIYDKNGCLIGINSQGVRDVGAKSKRDLLGVCFFDNPNFTEEIKAGLKAGESLQFEVECKFDRLADSIKTSKQNQPPIKLEVSATVVRDSKGEIDKYFIISREITERVYLQQRYESLNNRNSLVLNSIPSGISLYAPDGTLLYGNYAFCQIFGADYHLFNQGQVNILSSPEAPDRIKQAIIDQQPLHDYFEYDFSSSSDADYYTTARSGKRVLECNGKPIYNGTGVVESYILVIEDVTESIHKENQLLDSRRKVELAMHAADIMLWEFNVESQLFLSENEPLNGFEKSKPISVDLYIETISPDEQEEVSDITSRMMLGENFSFCFDAHVKLFADKDWQYCTINGSPCEFDENGRVTKYVGTRKNNTELHQQRNFYEKILNELPLSILIKDIENDFRYVFCNKESKDMFGMVEGGSTYDILNQESVDRIHRTDLEVYKTGKLFKGLEEIIINNGKKYNTIVQKNIIDNFGKRLLLSVRWDQSVQIELKRQANLLNLSLEVMDAYSWLYELDIERISFGDEFHKMGRNVSEVNTLEKFVNSVHPDDQEEFVASLKRVVEGEQSFWSYQFRFDNTGHGNYIWNEVKGVLETTIVNEKPYTYMLGMTVSIEEHKRIEQTLLNNREELSQLLLQNELILNNTNSGLAFITPDYMVEWENISQCSSSITFEAYKKGEICYQTAHNRNSPCKNCVLERAMRSRQVERISFCLQNDRMVEIFATPVINPNGSIDGIVIRVDDVTERQQMINELKHAKQQAEQSDKLKSAFLANMSHEIRTPLNAIVGFSELLVDASEEDKIEYSKIIKSNNDLLLGLINDILDLSKIESGAIELKCDYFDFAEYFNSMFVSMQKRITNTDVQLLIRNPYTVCHLYLDRVRITQITTNYVTNAIKYTPSGTIEMGYVCTQDGIRIYVKDTGIGITAEKKNKVFHRFAKLDEFAQGTGLGLSICKAAAELMGGTVGFEAEEGKGSLFWVFLPCSPQYELNEKEQPSDSLSLPFERRKVVLVGEDIPNNYLLVYQLLHKRFDLIHALNGKEVVEAVKNKSVDFVLMDMKMPIMDGMTATREIRKFDRAIPIIALTAHAFEADREAALDAGCNDYLIKPVDKEMLLAVLRKYGLY